MPLEVCKPSRFNRSAICKHRIETVLYKGFCTHQGMIYYGCKLHVVCSMSGDLKITKTSVYDTNYHKDIKHIN